MQRPELERERPYTRTVNPAPTSPGTPFARIAAAMLLLAGGVFAALMTHSQVKDLLEKRDGEALERAGKVLQRMLRDQQASLASMVGVLADDTRVRAAVMTPEFNEASVKDALADLKQASTASVLGILDLNGKVRAITGADELRDVDLGSSAAVQAAAQQPTTLVWTFPSQVLVIGIAPIHSGAESSALFMMGVSLGARTLGEVRDMMGVEGAVLIGDRIAASSSQDSDVHEAMRAIAAQDEDKNYVAGPAGEHLVRLVKTGKGTSAAKVALAIPRADRMGPLPLLAWTPALIGFLGFVIVMSTTRRSSKGEES